MMMLNDEKASQIIAFFFFFPLLFVSVSCEYVQHLNTHFGEDY